MKIFIINKTLHRERLEQLIKEHLNPFAIATLDVGSGNRRYDHWLRNRSVAVDIVSNKENDVRYGDVRSISFNNQFDQVVCFEVLEYLNYPDIIIGINNLIRAVKISGTVLLSMIYNAPEHQELTKLSAVELSRILNFISGIKTFRIISFGNSTTVILDAFLCKYKLAKGYFLKEIFRIVLWFARWVIKILGRHRRTDKFYSGNFVIITK